MDKKTLVERCQHGDREALGLLYSKYSARMMKIIRHYIADPADAGDILHDGFIVAFTQIASLRNPDKLEYWLGTIMKNLSIQHLNQVELNTLLDEDADITDMPEIQDLISLEELEAIINLLPDGYRKVFKLAVLDNKSHREIGKLLGIAPHSSSSQLFRAKEMLRKIIREQGLELAGAVSIIALLLALMPRLLNSDLSSPTPIADETLVVEEGQFLAITRPAEDEVTAEETGVDTPIFQAHVNQPATSESDKTSEEYTDETTVSTLATSDSIQETAKADESSDPATTNGNSKGSEKSAKEHKNSKSSGGQRPLTSGSSYSDSYIASNTKKSHLSISATFRTSGFNTLPGLGTDIDNISNGAFDSDKNNPENPEDPNTPPSYIQPHKSKAKPQTETINDVEHSATLSFGVTANLRLTRTLSLESGLMYSYLRSRVTTNLREYEYKNHYIGIPLKLNLSLYTNSRLNIYGSAGGAVDIPISSTKSTDSSRTNMTAPTQWSLSGGVGLQYRLSPTVSIYAEPSVRYNFHNSDTEVVNKWQDNRFEFTLPMGLRFNF